MVKKLFIRLCMVIGLLTILLGARHFLTGYSLWLDTLVSCVTYPALVLQYAVVTPVNSLRTLVRERLSVDQELQALEEERQSLQARIIELESILVTHNELAELSEFKKRYAHHHALTAQIIFKQCSSQEQYFLVDAGSHKGIMVDMVAVYKQSLVGRVAEVFPYYSKVILITDPRCKVAAQCTQTGAQGIHEGVYQSDRTALSFVSHLQQLNEGDLIISSGEGLVFPRGFGLGHVASYKLAGLHYVVDVKPLIDIDTIRYCVLLSKGAEHKEGPPLAPADMILQAPKDQPPVAAPIVKQQKRPVDRAVVNESRSVMPAKSHEKQIHERKTTEAVEQVVPREKIQDPSPQPDQSSLVEETTQSTVEIAAPEPSEMSQQPEGALPEPMQQDQVETKESAVPEEPLS